MLIKSIGKVRIKEVLDRVKKIKCIIKFNPNRKNRMTQHFIEAKKLGNVSCRWHNKRRI